MNESTVLLETSEPADAPAESVQAPLTIEVRRNAAVSGVVGAVASLVAVAYLVRALGGGGALDWLVFLALAACGAAYLTSFLDARLPLLVADERGVRIRLGRSWCGMAWDEIDEVEHTPRLGRWREGRLVLLPVDEDARLARLTPGGRRQAMVNRRLYRAAFAVPLSMTTRVAGTSGDLTTALLDLVGDAATVVEVDRSLPDHIVDDSVYPTVADPAVGAVDDAVDDTTDDASGDTVDHLAAVPDEPFDQDAPTLLPSPTPSPERKLVLGARHDGPVSVGATALQPDADDMDTQSWSRQLPEAGELRRAVPDLDETVSWSLPPLDAPDEPETQVVTIDDADALTPQPAPDPVVGPVLAAARSRIGLGVDQLADRTRIRPHVIEAIEVDDFGPCGGDFYARGHLRTLARVLGVETAPLIADYDERYADAPIDPRRVFEAELATANGGAIRGTRGGPNWSVLVAAVMALVLIWSIARLLVDGSASITPPVTGIPAGSGNGPTNPYGQVPPPVPVSISAPAGGARLIVRDATGKVIFNDQLSFGATHALRVSLPMRVSSTDGSVHVVVEGHDLGAMGKTGEPAQKTYTAQD